MQAAGEAGASGLNVVSWDLGKLRLWGETGTSTGCWRELTWCRPPLAADWRVDLCPKGDVMGGSRIWVRISQEWMWNVGVKAKVVDEIVNDDGS